MNTPPKPSKVPLLVFLLAIFSLSIGFGLVLYGVGVSTVASVGASVSILGLLVLADLWKAPNSK